MEPKKIKEEAKVYKRDGEVVGYESRTLFMGEQGAEFVITSGEKTNEAEKVASKDQAEARLNKAVLDKARQKNDKVNKGTDNAEDEDNVQKV